MSATLLNEYGMVWYGMVWYGMLLSVSESNERTWVGQSLLWIDICAAKRVLLSLRWKKDFPHTTDSSIRQNKQQLESKHKLFCRPTGGNDVDQRQEQYRATSMSICECWCWSVFCVDVFNRKKLQNSLNGAGTSRLVDMSTGSRSRWMYRSADGHTDRELRIL